MQPACLLFWLVAAEQCSAHNPPKENSIGLPVLRRIRRSANQLSISLPILKRREMELMAADGVRPIYHKLIKVNKINSINYH